VEWVPLIEVTNMARALEEFKKKGFWIWGADMDGEASSKVNLKGKTALVMGREGEGLHQLVKDGCDGLIRIPTGGRLDSLNVATAAGILMYESRRQQGFPYSGN
ncbi:MAG: RNA methyltransferase, partial [Spirochaetaceae bacterium]|nr:RNA methyltransferase [Spirochaetaceae bacterium]